MNELFSMCPSGQLSKWFFVIWTSGVVALSPQSKSIVRLEPRKIKYTVIAAPNIFPSLSVYSNLVSSSSFSLPCGWPIYRFWIACIRLEFSALRPWRESFQFGIGANVDNRLLRKGSHLCRIWFRVCCSPHGPRWCRRGQEGSFQAGTPSVPQWFPEVQEAPRRSCKSPVPLSSPQTVVASSNTSRSANSSSRSQHFCKTRINSCYKSSGLLGRAIEWS